MGSVRRVRVGFHLMSARFVKFKKMLTDVSLGSEIMRYIVFTPLLQQHSPLPAAVLHKPRPWTNCAVLYLVYSGLVH